MRVISNCKKIILEYVKNNFKEYVLIMIIFIIGLFIGVLIINNIEQSQIDNLKNYIEKFIEKIKSIENIDNLNLFMESMKSNLYLALILWGAGTTIIGLPIVLLIILIRGLYLGYTIGAITYTLGTLKGIYFCLCTIMLQNLLFIPAIFTIGVSSIKLYKSIIKERQKEEIKKNILKHIIISIIMVIILIISSSIEIGGSLYIFKKSINFF